MQIKNFVVISNRNATKLQKNSAESHLHKRTLEPLKALGAKVLHLCTPTHQELHSSLDEGAVLVACGGDGTTNWVVNAIANHDISEHVTLIPQPYGGANDIAGGLYGGSGIHKIVGHGMRDQAGLITAEIKRPGQDIEVVHALGYIGVGSSGKAAHQINSNREGLTKIKEARLAASAVLGGANFDYFDESGRLLTAYEMLALNGRMSYVIKPRRDSYFAPEHQFVEAGSKLDALTKIACSSLRRVRGKVQHFDDYKAMSMAEDVYLQTDGEAHELPAMTDITIKNGPQINLARL